MAEVKGRLGDKSYFNIKVNILNLEYSRLFFVYQFKHCCYFIGIMLILKSFNMDGKLIY